MKLVSVVLSGGAGTRLWPASRQGHPKPFMKLGGSTLLAQAIGRGQACGTDELLVITNEAHLYLTKGVLEQMTDPPHAHYLLEPQGRNTAPAIALAALHVAKAHGPETIMVVLPADHLIPDTRSFVACALEAAELARQGRLVVFGIHPTTPETAFGYLEVEHVARESQKVLRFVEKPDVETAQEYLATGRYLWNSGMFCFSAGAILDAFQAHSPHVFEPALGAMETARRSGDQTCFDTHQFGLQPDISIDYAVFEKARNVSVVPARFGWSDVGSWPSVAEAHGRDASGNSLLGDVLAIDTRNTHVQVDSHGGQKIVAVVGVQDLVVVDTPDALLVAHKSAAQKIKGVVDTLKARGHGSTLMPSIVTRPWGTFAALQEDVGYKVKRISVKPGKSLSLQYHHQRAEHWVVVQGLALVQIGDEEHRTEPGQYRYIPLKEKHRVSNIGEGELVMIEVQCGPYLGEDDIVRLADTFGRV